MAAPAVDPPPAARQLFADRLPAAERFAEWLVTDGVVRGLLGPREAPRIWQRHLLNCAAMAELCATGESVTDVGSGAGLPGVVLAVARPDLSVTLVEPMLRRVSFLTEVVTALGMDGRVQVQRCRAEEALDRLSPAGVVTARALAPLDRLVRWCLPLARPGGRVLALKGSRAAQEVAEHAAAVRAEGGAWPVIHHCGRNVLDPPATVVEIVRERRRADGPAG